MQDKPSLILTNSLVTTETTSNNKNTTTQHALQSNRSRNERGLSVFHPPRCFLLSIPSESLNHITSYVGDPLSLLALSLVSRRLRDHVAEDSTWYHAFAFHYWGIGPESDPEDEQKLVLRRSDSTWKKEFIKRFNVLHRWEKSRSSTLSYRPHYWSISGMHLLDSVSLLTSNLQYGIVTRSFPLTGKILKGHLDASGTANGLGIGNPNEEFTPNVSCVALSSCGGTGRIAWGFRSGQVAATSASRVMDSNRPAARFVRGRIEDEHPAEVRCAVFAGRDDDMVLSGCARGLVKLWDAKRMRCLWTGYGKREEVLVSDPCYKVLYGSAANVIVATMQSGDVVFWWGFQPHEGEGTVDVESIRSVRVNYPEAFEIFFIDPNFSNSKASILLHSTNGTFFLRITLDTITGNTTTIRFCDGPLGPITSIKPCFALQPTVVFVLAGDALGRVCIWAWDAEGKFSMKKDAAQSNIEESLPEVKSSMRWEAHDDGAICAIECNDLVIVTGSTAGTLRIWDILTLDPLRSFTSPGHKGAGDPVGQIILRGDLLLASVGSRVLVWQVTAVAPVKKGKSKHVGKAKSRNSGAINKWQQQIELKSDIRESKLAIADERAHEKRVNGRARAERAMLDRLGLDETEAVAYLLMLSREEEERRVAAGGDLDSEGIFVFDDPEMDAVARDFATLSAVAGQSSSSPSNIHPRIDLSPPLRPITVSGTTGRASSMPLAIRRTSLGTASLSPASTPASSISISLDDPDVFPTISPIGSLSPGLSSMSGTPSRAIPHLAGSWSRGSPSIASSPASAASFSQGRIRTRGEEEDEELRYVLELSLAEARSRGEA
ncbi:WD40-repeat-containing domain protein [Hysterangium stoloniferum]|nr:WD40-repeat-containing domain protein [Hysterangium stoloniferum]